MGFPDELPRVVIKEGIALVGQHGDMIAVCGQGDDVPVSYTHLDVYKRQLDAIATSGLTREKAAKFNAGVDATLFGGLDFSFDGFYPVSYTHLDVYKRQTIARLYLLVDVS